MKYTGKILVLAYPDTFVRISDDWICKVLPYVGIGTKEYLKAGHAALVLIENATGNAEYYDFGRYITPNGKGRVRSAVTDTELKLPFKAQIDADARLINLEEFLHWLDANPKKTHGEGRLLTSVCEMVDYHRARAFILELQSKGSVRYAAFKEGSNCSRFVTDTILSSTDDPRIISALKKNKLFTPSTVGNVEKAASGDVYQVFEGNISKYSGSALKENLTNYFHKKSKNGTVQECIFQEQIEKVQLLSGIGSSAYFSIDSVSIETCESTYKIKRYDELGTLDFEGFFKVDNVTFNIKETYSFIHDSNCSYCHIEQSGTVYRFDKIEISSENVSLMQKVHLA